MSSRALRNFILCHLHPLGPLGLEHGPLLTVVHDLVISILDYCNVRVHGHALEEYLEVACNT